MANQKLKEFILFKANPELAMFQFVKKMEQDLKEEAARIIKAELAKALKNFQQKDPVNAGFIEKIVNKTVAQLVKDTKGDIGVTGAEGKTPTRGEDYFTKADIKMLVDEVQSQLRIPEDGADGYTPVAGKDYSTKEEILGYINELASNIRVPKDGRTLKPGIDFFTDKDKREMVRRIEESFNFKRILQEIINMKDMFDEFRKAVRFGGQRTLHRGGIDMIAGEVPSGTINGINVTFTLNEIPRTNTESIYENGVRLKRGGEDYAISGKVLTFVTAPPNGSLLLADYQTGVST